MFNIEFYMQRIRLYLNKFPLLQSILNFMYRLIFISSSIKKVTIGYCPVCGKNTLMLIDTYNLRGAGTCLLCSANSRYKSVTQILKKIIFIKSFHPDIERQKLIILMNKINLTGYSLKQILSCIKGKDFWIYEPSSVGAIYNILKNYPKFFFSEYFPHPNLKKGQRFKGIRYEDLQLLSFKNDSIDILITQDTLEHVEKYPLAFREINRVLKPNGVHIFTVPIDNFEKTFRFFDDKGSLLEKKIVYHKDPLRYQGAKVYTQFGYDIVNILDNYGFSTLIISPKIGIFEDVEILVSIKKPDY